jgi:peptide/nickel transport system substrate-binding protein
LPVPEAQAFACALEDNPRGMEDSKEGPKAFAEKRMPVFRNRQPPRGTPLGTPEEATMNAKRLAFCSAIALAIAAVSIAAAGSLAQVSPVAAQGGPRYGGVLKIASTGDPYTCDLPTGSGGSILSVIACAPMLNQLVKYDPADPQAIVPDAAQSWELSGDGLTWTFALAPNATWHDGAALTSLDAFFSLARIITPPQGIAIRSPGILQDYVSQVQAPDGNTLQIITGFSAPSLLANLASVHVALYPKAVTEALSPPSMETPCEVVGSGPFRCQQYIPGS